MKPSACLAWGHKCMQGLYGETSSACLRLSSGLISFRWFKKGLKWRHYFNRHCIIILYICIFCIFVYFKYIWFILQQTPPVELHLKVTWSTICNLQAIQEFEESLVTFLSQSKTLRPASMPRAFCCFSSNVLWVLLFVSLETDFSLSFPFPIISTSGKVYST